MIRIIVGAVLMTLMVMYLCSLYGAIIAIIIDAKPGQPAANLADWIGQKLKERRGRNR